MPAYFTAGAGAALPALAATALLLIGISSNAPAEDDRQVYSGDGHQWLQAVGRLRVPGSRKLQGSRNHYNEDCSATLVSRSARNSADTIVTAWHCLEFYNDLSKPIVFTLTSVNKEVLRREAYRLADGGGMHADWAILRLYEAVPTQAVAPIGILSGGADLNRQVTMAGYSRDSGIGNNGEHLTFDANCSITSRERNSSHTDCTAHKGASGGAVVQLNRNGQALLAGVISQGDGNGLSIYVPVTGFRNALSLHLR